MPRQAAMNPRVLPDPRSCRGPSRHNPKFGIMEQAVEDVVGFGGHEEGCVNFLIR
jgi:hypothetical protein